jgi:hypothetical protein
MAHQADCSEFRFALSCEELAPQAGFEPATLRLTAAALTSDQGRQMAMKIQRSFDLPRFSSRRSISVNDGRPRRFRRVTSQCVSQIRLRVQIVGAQPTVLGVYLDSGLAENTRLLYHRPPCGFSGVRPAADASVLAANSSSLDAWSGREPRPDTVRSGMTALRAPMSGRSPDEPCSVTGGERPSRGLSFTRQ